ncbi:MAG: DUF6705 family protein [Ferruginibacter sp.]
MKLRIFLLTIFIASSCIAFGQVPAPGSNITRSSLDKFEGTWKWTSGSSEVIIQLKKFHYYFTDHQFYEDIILGSHKYTNNGTLIEDYLPDFINISQSFQSSLFLYAEMDGTLTDNISGDLKDNSKHKRDLLQLTYIPGSTPTLIWHLQPQGDAIALPVIAGVTLPEDLILVKQ